MGLKQQWLFKEGKGKSLTFAIHKLRQAIGLIYLLMYAGIFFVYAFLLEDDRSWQNEFKFTITVFIWFVLSLAVKVSMVIDRFIELLNLLAVLAFLSIGFTYHPNLYHPSSIQNFSYYLYFIGGSACDFFDFIYQGAASPQKDRLTGTEQKTEAGGPTNACHGPDRKKG